MLHVRIDEATKTQASEALASMGLTVSEGVRLFLHRVVADQALPLELKVPNAETRAAIIESRRLMAARKPRFASATALLDELEKKATRE